MKGKIINRHTCLNVIGAMILLVGLGSAFLIYQREENDSDSVLGYEEGRGSVYPIRPEDSKKYLRDMELYGGKANVLVDEFRRWVIGLWQGKSLAFTVAGIALLISAGFFTMGYCYYPPGLKPDPLVKSTGIKPPEKTERGSGWKGQTKREPPL